MKETKETRGRKKYTDRTAINVQKSISLPVDMWKWIDKQKSNRSETIKSSIKKEMENKKNE